MDVLIVSVERDFANVSYTLQQSLRAIGVDALALTLALKSPTLSNSASAKIIKVAELKRYAEQSKIIQFMHSLHINLGVKNKRMFVYHGGGRYRENFENLNKIFNPIVEKCIIQTGDLFELGAKNEVWLLPAVDTEGIKPIYERQNKKIIVGHFPTSTSVKNSEDINKVINNLKKDFGDKFDYISSSSVIGWSEHIKRVSKCDIYIEACTPHLNDKKYGEWGVSGVEAAALGKVVITHFFSHERYKKEYGKCCLKIANSLVDVEKHMRKLLILNNDELLQIKKDTRVWVEKFHSYHAVGKKLKEIVYQI